MNGNYKIPEEQIYRALQELCVDGYESPIDVIIKHETAAFNVFIEEAVMKEVIKADVHVDKEELKKALIYDRKQYDTGFRNGWRAAKKFGYWAQSYDGNGDRFTYTCSICGEWEKDNFTKHYRFCPHCGAQMLHFTEPKPVAEEEKK